MQTFKWLVKALRHPDYVKDIAQTYVNRFFILALGFISSVIISRYLGPEGRGEYAYTILIIGLGMQFGNVGLHSANVYFLSRDRERLPTLFGNSIFVSIIIGGLLLILGIIYAELYPELIPIKKSLWLLALACIPISILCLLLQNLLLGLNNLSLFNKAELYGKMIATLLILFGLVVIGYRSINFILFSILISTLCAVVIIYKYLRGVSDWAISFNALKKDSCYGFKAYISALFSFVQQRIAVALVERLGGFQELGYFSSALMIFDLALMLPIVASTILFPKISSETNNRTKWFITRRNILAITVIMIIFGLLIAFFPKIIIYIIFGNDFIGAEKYLIWMLPGLIALSISSLMMNYLAASGMPNFVIAVPLIGIGVFLYFYWVLFPLYGVQAVALSLSAGYVVTVIVLYAYIIWDFKNE